MTNYDYWILDFKTNWKMFLTSKKNIRNLICSILLFFLTSYLFKVFLIDFEKIQGVMLYDIVLQYLPVYDLSLGIFIVLYTTVFFTFIFLLAYPILLNLTLVLYTLSLLLRLSMLFLINLEPPLNIIYLNDPFLNASTYNGLIITKDLFFSGHAISILVCYFIMPNLIIKRWYLLITISLMIMILIQHIHYTVDLIGAYIAVFLLYKIYFRQQLRNKKNQEHYASYIFNLPNYLPKL